MDNEQLALQILKTAEEKHINLYHSVSKKTVLEHFNNVDWNKLDDIHFDYEMKKIFALFKEEHTGFYSSSPFIMYNKKVKLIEGKFYLTDRKNEDAELLEIVSVNGVDIKTLTNKVLEICNAEYKEMALNRVPNYINNAYTFKMLDMFVDKKITFVVKNIKGFKKIKAKLYTEKQTQKYLSKDYSETETNYEIKYYDKILYLKFSNCNNRYIESFKKAVESIRKDYQNGKFDYYILDLRNNFGGGCRGIYPFEDLVEEYKLLGVVLMNFNTVSAATSAVVDFKERFNTPLIGKTPATVIPHYGECDIVEIEGKKFRVSTKLISQYPKKRIKTKLIYPDIEVDLSVDDMLTKRDSQLETAIQYIKENYVSKNIGT